VCPEVLPDALASCCREDAEGPWVLDILSRCARFCCVLGEGWAEKMLPSRPQISESFAEE
jgi:hypothetical protein